MRMRVVGQNGEFVVGGGGGEMMGVVRARRKVVAGELEDVEMMAVAAGRRRRRRRMRRAFVGRELDGEGVVRRDVGRRRRSFGFLDAVDLAREKRCSGGGGGGSGAHLPAFGVFDARHLRPASCMMRWTSCLAM